MGNEVRQYLAERRLHFRQRHPVLGAARPRDRRKHRAEVERKDVGKDRVRRGVGSEEELFLAVPFDPLDHLAWTAGALQVAESLGIYGEEADSRAVLG